MNDEFWQLQKAAKLSNSQAAEYHGVNISTIKRWRNGAITPPISVVRDLKYRIKYGPLKDESELYQSKGREMK